MGVETCRVAIYLLPPASTDFLFFGGSTVVPRPDRWPNDREKRDCGFEKEDAGLNVVFRKL